MTEARRRTAMTACLALGLADLMVWNLVVVPRARPGWSSAARGPTLFAAPPIPAAAAVVVPAPPPPAPPVVPPAAAVQAARPATRAPALVFFATNMARLRADGRETLQQLARTAADARDALVVVEGHADARGGESWNEKLSEERAEAVARLLRAAGVPPTRIVVRAFGSSRPATPGSDPASLQRNRRVEILFQRRST